MFINPMKKIESIEDFKMQYDRNTINNGQGQNFQNIFSELVNNVASTDKSKTNTEYLLASGQLDDAHTMPIESAKAQLSLDLLVQMRNKAIDSYNELMRINL